MTLNACGGTPAAPGGTPTACKGTPPVCRETPSLCRGTPTVWGRTPTASGRTLTLSLSLSEWNYSSFKNNLETNNLHWNNAIQLYYLPLDA